MGGLFRRDAGGLADRLHQRAGARAVLEDALPPDGAVLRRRRRRARCRPTRSSSRGMIFDHNDMHPPVPSLQLQRGRRRRRRACRRRGLGRARRRRSSCTRSIRRSAPAPPRRLERDEHHAARHLRRARRHLSTTCAPPARCRRRRLATRRDGLHVRPPRRARAGDRRSRRRPRAGTIIHDEMHHAAVIATLWRKYGLEPLTARDAARATSATPST